ncbi:MAG TPA: hypothetical protein VLC93_17995, partial [Myxococcota bacterium]|nr:hypothetical protein [Myxococcota bacterium]
TIAAGPVSQEVADSLSALFVDLSLTRTSAGFRSVVDQIGILAARPDCPEASKLAALECLRREEQTTRAQESVTPLPGVVAQIGLSGSPEVRRKAVQIVGEWAISWRHFGPHLDALNAARARLLMNSTPA